jgi:CheY-like chemotaxis protein
VNRLVLIIEDEPDLRETLKDLFEISGYDVITAGNGRDGLNVLQQSPKSPCIILLDLMMPVMNGWQFLDAIKQAYPQFLSSKSVVVVSAAADIRDPQSLYGCDVVRKPADIDKLLSLAQQCCASA